MRTYLRMGQARHTHTHTRLHRNTPTHTRTHTHRHTQTHRHTHTHTHTYTHMRTFMHVKTHIPHACEHRCTETETDFSNICGHSVKIYKPSSAHKLTHALE